MYCTNCGAQIPDGSRFCTNCGKQVAVSAVSEPPVSEPVQNVEETVVESAVVETQEQIIQPAEEETSEAATEATEEIQEEVSQPAEEETSEAALEATEEAQEEASQPVEQEIVAPQPEEPQAQAPQAAEALAGAATAAQSQFGQPVNPQAAGEPTWKAAETPNQFNQPTYQQAPAQVQPAPQKKMKKGALIGIIAGAVALIAIILVLLFVVFKIGKPNIDFSKYVKVEYTGYDGGGRATATMDREKFLQDYSGKIKYAPKYKYIEAEGYPAAEELIDYYVFCSMDSYETNLKNGDEIICSIWGDSQITKMFNVSVKNEKQLISEDGLKVPITVEGLEEAELFDPFEGIKISYTGVDPYGELVIDWSGCPEPTKENDFYFEIDKEYDLKNGDKVTITLDENAVDYFLSSYGMAPSPTSYTFTVEGLPMPQTSLSQIDAASMSEFETACNTIIEENYIKGNPEGITTSSYKLAGCILKVKTEPSMYGNNTLYAVYEINNMIENSQPYTVYTVYSFTDVGINDGKLSFDPEDYYAEYHSTKITAGNWEVTEFYGFASLEDVKSHFISTDDPSYGYETNLP